MSSQLSLIPAKHRNKLKILVVLKGFSHIACGKGMKVQDHQKKLFDFVYGKPPHVVSNYELVVKGLSNYVDLYEEETFKQIKQRRQNCQRGWPETKGRNDFRLCNALL